MFEEKSENETLFLSYSFLLHLYQSIDSTDLDLDSEKTYETGKEKMMLSGVLKECLHNDKHIHSHFTDPLSKCLHRLDQQSRFLNCVEHENKMKLKRQRMELNWLRKRDNTSESIDLNCTACDCED